MDNRKKILLFIDWYLPGYKGGGPIKSCSNLVDLLQKELTFYIVTRNTDFNDCKPYEGLLSDSWVKSSGNVYIYYFSKEMLTIKRQKEIIEEVNAEILYLNSMYSLFFSIVPLILTWGKKGIKVILAPRGMLYASAIGQKKMKKSFFLFLFRFFSIQKKIKFHSTNKDETLAIKTVFPDALIYEVDNVPQIKIQEFVDLYKEKGKLKCLFASRIVPIKNLSFVLEIMRMVRSQVELNIVGPIEDQEYWNRCQHLIKELPSNIKVTYLGSAENNILLNTFLENHLLFLPTLGENFGHIIFESFWMGRPVIISDKTPWRNLKTKAVGWDIDLNDKHEFIDAIETAANWNQEEFSRVAYSAHLYGKEIQKPGELKSKYLQLFN